jgi:hypothetical protein
MQLMDTDALFAAAVQSFLGDKISIISSRGYDFERLTHCLGVAGDDAHWRGSESLRADTMPKKFVQSEGVRQFLMIQQRFRQLHPLPPRNRNKGRWGVR